LVFIELATTLQEAILWEFDLLARMLTASPHDAETLKAATGNQIVSQFVNVSESG
jgi:hypothetical protein